MSFWWHVQAPSGHHCVISTNNLSQISCKISDFRHPPNTWNGVLCCTERHPLLLECFITFPCYVRGIEGTSDSIYKPLSIHIVSLLPITNPKFHAKHPILGATHHLSIENGMMCYKERCSLLAECVITLLTCVRMIGGDSDSMRKPVMVHNGGWHVISRYQQLISDFIENVRFQAPSQHRK